MCYTFYLKTDIRKDLYFADGKRRIDYVIVHSPDDSLEDKEARKIFEINLQRGGLELECEPIEVLRTINIFFNEQSIHCTV